MSVWTSSIPFEIENHNDVNLFMVQVNKDLWIINNAFSEPDQRIYVQFFHFNTELEKLFKVNIEYVIDLVVAHGHEIFLVGRSFRFRHSVVSLVYRLDTNTKEIELLSNLGHLSWRPVAIIGSFLYNLGWDENSDECQLEKLDLTGGQSPKILMTQIPYDDDYHLTTIDNTLYLLKVDLMEKTRTVMKLLDDGVELVHNDMFRGVATDRRVWGNKFDTFLTLETENNGEQKVHIEKFDFEANIWIREACLKEYQALKLWKSVSIRKIDDIIYMVFNSRSSPSGYEIGIIERQPNLTKTCIRNVIDQIIASGDLSQVEEFEKSLPDTLKHTASSMIHWRIREHEYLMNRGQDLHPLREAEEAQNGDVEELQEMMNQ